MLVLLSFEELTTPDAGVLVGVLVDLDCIVSAEEGDDEFSALLVLVLGDESRLETHDVLVVGEELGHVLLGRLGLETEDAAQRIFGSSVAIEGRNLMLDGSFLALLDLNRHEFNTQLVSVVSFGEVISIIDNAVPSEDVDMLADGKILRRVEFFLLETHSRVDSVDGLLG